MKHPVVVFEYSLPGVGAPDGTCLPEGAAFGDLDLPLGLGHPNVPGG